MFRKLRADEIEVRVGSVMDGAATLLLYKNARVDMDVLDETVGAMYWKREHSRDNANCTVSLYNHETKEWVSKEDTGTESFTEREKGLASDSFKRACVNWGIGRELYTAPRIKIKCETVPKRNGNGFELKNRWQFYNAEVAMIAYDETGCINALQIAKGRTIIYDMDNRAESYPDVNKAAEEMKETITEGQAQTLNEMISETGTDRKAFMEYYKVDSFMKLTKEQYGDALNILHNKKLKAEEKGKVIGTE